MGDFLAYDGGQKWKQCNVGTITAPAGTNSKGAYSSVENPLQTTACGIYLFPKFGGTGNRYGLIDIAVDPADDPIISNIAVSEANIAVANSSFYFPLEIPRASKLYARYQTSGSGSVVDVRIALCPSGLFAQGFKDCDTYGVTTSTSKATVVTPGASWTKGSYVALTTSVLSDVKALVFAFAHDSFTINNAAIMVVDVATGVGSPTSIIINNMAVHTSGAVDSYQIKSQGPFMTPVPRGNGIWARAASEISSPETFAMAVYGLR